MLSRRTALTRSTPLRRGGPLRRTPMKRGGKRLPARRGTTRRSSRIENPHYLAWLRLQRCGVAIAFPDEAAFCDGPIDPEHKREGVGMGQRASDVDAWACCRRHHDERHDGRGPFATMSRGDLRAFIRMQIAMYRAAYTLFLAEMPRVAQPGDPVSLGAREGAVTEVFADRVRVRWLDGSTTDEPIPPAPP